MLTCGKSILLHFVPVVQELKDAVPVWDPPNDAWKENQFTSAVLLEPFPNSRIQTVNLLAVTASTQTAAPFRGFWLFAVWPTEARTVTCCPP